jgi:hypothetical protein
VHACGHGGPRTRFVLGALATVALGAEAPKSISASEAASYVGQKKTVCGAVVSSKFAKDSNRSPTFLNLDRPYPNQVFTAVIWGATGRSSRRLLRWRSKGSASASRGRSSSTRRSRKSLSPTHRKFTKRGDRKVGVYPLLPRRGRLAHGCTRSNSRDGRRYAKPQWWNAESRCLALRSALSADRSWMPGCGPERALSPNPPRRHRPMVMRRCSA